MGGAVKVVLVLGAAVTAFLVYNLYINPPGSIFTGMGVLPPVRNPRNLG